MEKLKVSYIVSHKKYIKLDIYFLIKLLKLEVADLFLR